MTIAHRLILFVSIAVLTMLSCMGVSLYQNFQIKKQQDYIGSTIFPSMRAFRDITELVGEYRRLLTSFNRVAGTPEEKSLHVLEDMSATENKLDEAFAAYLKVVPAGEETRLLEKTHALWKGYLEAAKSSIPFAQNHQFEPLEAKRVIIRKTGAEFFKAMRAQVEFSAAQQQSVQAQVEAATHQAIVVSLAMVTTGVVVVGLFGWLLYRKTVLPLHSLSQLMVRAKNERNLTLRVESSGKDEVAQTIQAFNQFLAGLRDDFVLLHQSSTQLHAASNSMSATAERVAVAASSQSERSSSIAAATQQLTVSIHHVADRAKDTRQASDASSRLAMSGVAVISDAVSEITNIASTAQQTARYMQELETRAQSVEQVVGVIRGLADQTNLLALNAAIEAARAGEHGRGFAVVADEVRKLAEHTTKSTVDIGNIIGNILSSAGEAGHSVEATVNSIAQGVTRTEEANQTVAGINEHAQRAVGMVEEISDALAEQSAAAVAISQQIEQMAQTNETNVDASNQTRLAAEHLNGLANQMQQVFSRYRIQ
ncbi:MAG: methyl-accepting chemotaxis protein [Rhodocyclales bacterium GT-UBC]|nr:MAG: methyl-accepting chemotaxis protein [Rhodocyclales bacterium GT-UBC]